MSKLLDLSGQRFGRLVALDYERAGKRTYWRCMCDSGTEHRVETNNLRRGKSRSCGCLGAELASERNSTHHRSGTQLYRAWASMKRRCNVPACNSYPDYGGRGITVCERWETSFESFMADMGEPPTAEHSIDRIDVNGNYEPGNCRWATNKQQSRNKRNNRLFSHEGRTATLIEWAETSGVPLITIRKRLQSGVNFATAISPKNLRYGSIIQSLKR